MNDKRDGRRKERVGVVLSSKMQKTIVVQIKRKARHPIYGKVIEKANKFKVHDEKNEAKTGDRVMIVETRPLSKEKCWRLVKILSHGRSDSSKDVKDALAVQSPAEKIVTKAKAL